MSRKRWGAPGLHLAEASIHEVNKIALTAESWSIFVIAMIQAASRDLTLDGWDDWTHSLGWCFGLEVRVEVADCLMSYRRR